MIEQTLNGHAALETKVSFSSTDSPWPEEAFRNAFVEHYDRVAGILYRLVGDRARAEELTNDVFWRLYQQQIILEPEGNLGGWLYRTATHLGIDALRAAARRKQYEQAAARFLAESARQSDPLKEILQEEMRQRVRAVLASLRPVHAKLLILRASGFSYKELAEVLKVKAGSVGAMLIRAEAAFRNCYLRLHGHKEVL
ncbi:MAG TPA: sigma-70 family RNA polymerase sigma factor [Terriglobia bacterium]|nr:sigma-70 family RNA polymerase sigma factor [Terriglobia bacterium]